MCNRPGPSRAEDAPPFHYSESGDHPAKALLGTGGDQEALPADAKLRMASGRDVEGSEAFEWS
jgi:hypothetical protein